MIQNAIPTHCCMSNRPIQSMQTMQRDSLGNTHHLKVDRNLQWVSHHATNATYHHLLSGTMTQLNAQPQTTPPRHTIQSHAHKRCVLAI